MKHFMQRVRGHNLLEVIIATMIFSTTMIFVVSVWVVHSRSMSASSARLVAQHLAQKRIEECIEAGIDNIDYLVDSYVGTRTPMMMKETNRGTLTETAYSTNITAGPMDPATFCRPVTVTIFWHDALGDSSMTYRTQLAVPPP